MGFFSHHDNNKNSGCSYVESDAISPVLVSRYSTEAASASVILSPIFGKFSSREYSSFSSLYKKHPYINFL